MEKKRVVILGAGISGLAAAYAHRSDWEVVLLEKSASCGGMMQGIEKAGFFFECGPRTFRARHSPHLLQLVAELGLKNELIFSSPQAKKRYVLTEGKLQQVPSLSFLPTLVRALFRDLKQPACAGDESIYDFASRRFGKSMADHLFDPLALGIFGCDAREVSVACAFPQLKEWEARHGSVLKGLLRRRSRKPPFKEPLFSLRCGTPTLLHALENRLGSSIHLHEEALSLQLGKTLIVKTAQGEYPADKVISALPPHALAHLLGDLAPEAASILLSIPMTHLTVVHLGYSGSILPMRGFGYLVPTKEKEKLMGVVFDSEIFPEQNRGDQTRLTVMLHGQLTRENAVSAAQEGIKRHLCVCQTPSLVHVLDASLPTFQVGHVEKMASLQRIVMRSLPQFILTGNYLRHPSVESCLSSISGIE